MTDLDSLDMDEEDVTDVTQTPYVEPPRKLDERRGALVVMRGLETGRMFLLEQRVTRIGRDKSANVRYDDHGLSRHHARIIHEGERWFIEDAGSSNGTFVDGERIVARTELRDGARVVTSSTVLFRFNLVDPIDEHAGKQLFEASTRDALTNIYNRRYLDERLAAEVSFAHRHKVALGFVLFDVDHFKKVNDTHGHLAGDEVLRAVAQRMVKLIRVEDVLARYGGEEIAIVARGVPMQGLVTLAERIRNTIVDTSIPYEQQSISVTVSAGVAALEECDAHATGDLLVALADERLYRAKRAGRNRVCST